MIGSINRTAMEDRLKRAVKVDLDQRVDALVDNLHSSNAWRTAVTRHFKALAAELQPAPRVSEETIKTIAVDIEASLPIAHPGESYQRREGFRRILRDKLQPIKPAPAGVSDDDVEVIEIDENGVVHAIGKAVSDEQIERAVTDLWEEGMSFDRIRGCLKRHFQPKPKPQEPQVWEGEYPMNEWLSVKEWRPRHNGDYVQVMWGRDYESAGIWDDGFFYLMGPGPGESDFGPDVEATHFHALKEGPSAD